MWKLTLLSAPALEHDGRATHIPRRKAWALLAYLAVSRQRQTRETLAALLWPEYDERAGRADLSRVLSSLRKALDPGLFLSDRESVMLHTEAELWVDVRHFRELLDACRAAGTEGPDDEQHGRLVAAANLYQADFMAGFTLPGCPQFDEWQLLQSENRRRELAWALDELVRSDEARDDLAQAIGYARRRVSLDPLHEPAQRRLISLYARNGQRAEAHRQYQACVRLLADELGVEPQAETRQLYEEVRRRKRSAPQPPAFLDEAVEDNDEAPPFVGREEELRRMEAHLHAALRGDGAILFITGGAGRGKTSLLQQFTRHALERHPDLVVAAGSGKAFAGTGDPYLPFREVLEHLAGNVAGQGGRGQMPVAQARRLWALLPETAQAILESGPQLLDLFVSASQLLARVAAAGFADTTWAAALRSEVSRRRQAPGNLHQAAVLGQYSNVLQHLARKRPLLITLDDLQWLDDASTALLFHLGRQMRGSRLFIVGAYRADELPARDGEPHALAQLVAEFTRVHGDITIDLATADEHTGRQFVDAYVDTEPNRLDAAFRDALYALTGGHPLFTVELLREMQNRGDLIQDSAGQWRKGQTLNWQALPARVEAVIARRIERLDPAALAILSAASVEGQQFTAEVVARVLDMDESALLQILSQELAKRRRLVQARGEAEVAGRFLSLYAFAHVLFQQYLYRALDAGQRRRLHGAVAAALAELYADEPQRIVVQLAHHYAAAGQWEQAAPQLVQAGDAARHKASLPDAITHYEAALAHWPGGDAQGRAHILRKLGECLWMVGRHEPAIDALQTAYDLFRAARHPQGAGATQRLLGRAYWEMSQPRKAHQSLRRALRILESEAQGEELAWALAGLGAYHMHLGDYDEAIRLDQRALAISRRLDIEALTIQCLCDLGSALTGKGDWSGLDLERESLALALAANRAHDASRAYLYLAEGLTYLGHYEEARQTLQEALAYTHRLHLTFVSAGVARQLAELDWQTGHWQAALSRLFAAGAARVDEQATDLAGVYRRLLLGRVYNDLGHSAPASALLSEALAGATASLDPRLALLGERARTEVALKQPASALAAVKEILEWTDQAQYLYPNANMALLYICRWALDAGAPEPASLARSAWQQLQRLDRQYGTRATAASRLEGEGWLALIEQNAAQAIALFEQALTRWQALGHPYDRLRALSGLRQAYKMAGDQTRARTAGVAAMDLARSLAAQLQDAALKDAFLNSPLVREVRRHAALAQPPE